jgi:hypothetical protein
VSEVTAAEAVVAADVKSEAVAVESKATGIVATVEADIHAVIAALVARVHELEAHLGFAKPPIK